MSTDYLMHHSSPSATATSGSVFPFAPTPYNTYAQTDAFGSASSSDHAMVHGDEEDHIMPVLSQGPVDTVPYSTKPIPAPPLVVRHSDKKGDITESEFNSSGIAGSDHVSYTVDAGWNQEDIDAHRLRQLGYDPVLGRDYTFWSSLAIATCNIGCIQGVIFAVYGTYKFGGPTFILVAWPFSGIVSLSLTLMLAELASAYPVAGAMVSWSWKLARASIGGERQWGWLMSGIVLGGHMGGVLLVAWQLSDVVLGTMGMAFEYQARDWHQAGFFLAAILLCGLVGSTGWGRSHRLWLASGSFLVAVYLVLIISVLASVIKRGHPTISTEYVNKTPWSSKGLVYFMGWRSSTVAIGVDASAHMAEETQRPARNVPNAMVGSMVASYFFGYIAIILLLLAVPADDVTMIAAQSFPFGHTLAQAINMRGAIAICSLLIVTILIQLLAQLQATSRFVFSLARDNAMPFSEQIRRTNASKVPVVANWITVGLCSPFCLLVVANSSTLHSVLSAAAGSLTFWGYLVPIALYLLSGRDLQSEGRSSWSLRKFSKPCAVLGIMYSLCLIIAQMFPSKRVITVNSISWSPVVTVGTCLICLFTWYLYGSKHYSGPIRALTKWETGVEIDLQTTLANNRSKHMPTEYKPDADHGRTVTVRTAVTEEDAEWTDESSVGTETSLSAVRSRQAVRTTVGRISEEREDM